MERYQSEHTGEIVLTYHQKEMVEPVVLRYEHALPERMRKPELPPACDAAETPEPAALTRKERRRLRRAMRKRRGWAVGLFVSLSVMTILLCAGLGIWFMSQRSNETYLPPDAFSSDSILPQIPSEYIPTIPAATPETTIRRYPVGGDTQLRLEEGGGVLPVLTAQEVYEAVSPAVVTVFGYSDNGMGVGTGIVFSSDGYIVTNYHVIEGSHTSSVWFNHVSTEYEALLVGYDAEKDLAVLKVDLEDLPVATFGVSDELTVGDPVYAIGNPLGTELRNTFTNGIVSAVNRDVALDGGTSMTLIQTNAALNNGNSGGPLINQYGQVVGINTIKMMSSYDTIEGLGFAIPTSLAQRWVNELITYGKLLPQPLLGLSINKVPTTLPDGTVGLRVEEVSPGLGGEKAGVQVGDYVVAFAGQEVQATEEILAIRRTLYVGDQVTIRVWRDGQYLDLLMEMMAAAE